LVSLNGIYYGEGDDVIDDGVWQFSVASISTKCSDGEAQVKVAYDWNGTIVYEDTFRSPIKFYPDGIEVFGAFLTAGDRMADLRVLDVEPIGDTTGRVVVECGGRRIVKEVRE
jgi:hypothetical protein